MHLGSVLMKPRLPNSRVHCWFGPRCRLKQPDGPVGTIGQVLAARGASCPDLNPLSIRGLTELLSKVMVLRLEIIVLTKEP
jgi:hypothetical protein